MIEILFSVVITVLSLALIRASDENSRLRNDLVEMRFQRDVAVDRSREITEILKEMVAKEPTKEDSKS